MVDGSDAVKQIEITVAFCSAPNTVQEWVGRLPEGASVQSALRASGYAPAEQDFKILHLGIWGKLCKPTTALADGDRVEIYRELKVDPKVARRERFVKQGARTAGLFARDRKV